MIRITILLSLFVLSACSDGRHGGTSTETTNGSIAGTIRQGTNLVSGARVALYWPSGELFDSNAATTDSAGRFKIADLNGRFHVGVVNASLNAWRFNSVAGQDTALFLELLEPGTVGLSGAQSGDTIRLLGTPHWGLANENGDFTFTALPQGFYTVLVNRTPGATIRAISGVDSTHALNAPAQLADELLIEDFNDGDVYYPWSPYSGKGDWYVSAQGTSVITQPVQASRPHLAMLTDSAYEGRSLHIQYTGNDGLSENIVQVGLHLGQLALDLRPLTHIRFAVRGNCSLRVALETNQDQSYLKAIWNVPLTTEWSEVTIDVNSPIIDPQYAEHVPFSQIANHVYLLTFFAHGGTEFAIDRIRFVGIEPTDLLPKD